MSELDLSDTELKLYNIIVENNGELFYLVVLKDKPKLMGAVGKLVSKHIVKIERDPKQQFKDMRKKLVLINAK